MGLFKKKDFAYFEKEMAKKGFSRVGRVQVKNESNLKKVNRFKIRFNDDAQWRSFNTIKQLFKIGSIIYRLSFEPTEEFILAFNKETSEYFLYNRSSSPQTPP